MDLKMISSVVFVKDIEVSRDFYVNTLQQKVILDLGKNIAFESGFTIWEIRDTHIIAETLGSEPLLNRSCNRFELYFETEQITQVFQNLKVNKVRFMHEIHEEPWGQQTIRFFDPDNHLIEVGESMRQFVLRFYNQGLSVNEVSKRTFVPVDEVKRLIERTK